MGSRGARERKTFPNIPNLVVQNCPLEVSSAVKCLMASHTLPHPVAMRGLSRAWWLGWRDW